MTPRTAGSLRCSCVVMVARCAAHAGYRVRGVGLGVQHRFGLVDQGGERIQVLAGVDGQCRRAFDESGMLGPEPADGGVGLVDHRLQVVVRDGLQTAVGRVEQVS